MIALVWARREPSPTAVARKDSHPATVPAASMKPNYKRSVRASNWIQSDMEGRIYIVCEMEDGKDSRFW